MSLDPNSIRIGMLVTISMPGTSLDGLDGVVVDVVKTGPSGMFALARVRLEGVAPGGINTRTIQIGALVERVGHIDGCVIPMDPISE
jgi:hypothetical protein